jgi:predicted membrane-bound dolichyl-phosphate-mannose-protein mannosyltransferase
LAARADVIITAGLRPELFAGANLLKASRTLVVTTMALLVLAGFGLRVASLSAEGLSEDELNKLNAVIDYRQHGITSANGEHPMLMKTLQTITIVAAETLGSARVSPETALRLPSAIFGALTIILIYLLTAELFGAEVALIAAALWAFDPSAIGFNRIAKEDTFLLFFFLLANIFWLRGQRVAESDSGRRPQGYYWATAVAFGAMIASKYLPQLFAVTISYYWIFQQIPETRWRLGKKRMLTFFAIMALTFLVLSPAILLPGTWHEMGLFAGQKMVGHDGYEFMGRVYSHRLTEWLRGVPWYFYFVFMGVKLPLMTIAGFLLGLPLLFRRRLGDGRYFILFWLFFWVITFTFAGGKFTRYFTVMLPAVLITAAIGVQFAGRFLTRIFTPLSDGAAVYARTAVGLLVVVASLFAAASIAPHFRLYTNALGGGVGKAGFYFPHDEFYDASMRDLIAEIARRARPGARVASESPALAAYYAQRVNRSDLVCIWLSDAKSLTELSEGDFVINARGRRYFSNDVLISSLQRSTNPDIQLSLGPVPSAQVYLLDKTSLNVVNEQKSSDK